ncbi:semaphorin-5b isoform x3 [Limosa lapponica baueri]|uniref:Semaphorin-5b isoform x3 n=1 Tax=Limosa lapponica baueri TaxID=1758121 RepID=A0A2I0TVJ3_LIMLA|nr:semaphorin-5b isoform x3 [Limosa lapponica baueri]
MLSALAVVHQLLYKDIYPKASQNVPEHSEAEHQQCVRKEHPTIAFEDLKPWVSNFTYPGVHDFSQLALDANRNQLIVGARNYLFRLSLHNVSLIQCKFAQSDGARRRQSQNQMLIPTPTIMLGEGLFHTCPFEQCFLLLILESLGERSQTLKGSSFYLLNDYEGLSFKTNAKSIKMSKSSPSTSRIIS